MNKYINSHSIVISKVLCGLFICLAILSCEKEEAEDEDCMETICPEGYNSCIERPCDFDEFQNN